MLLPSYRKRLIRGRFVALVTLRCATTRRRHDVYLGDADDERSKQAYARVIAEWLQRGRKIDSKASGGVQSLRLGISVTELCHDYWSDVQGRFSPGHETNIKTAIRFLRSRYGETEAINFGPNSLRALRSAMVADDPPGVSPNRRRAWSRQVAQHMTRLTVGIFRWGVSHELIPASVHQALSQIEPLRAHPKIREMEPIKPVDWLAVDAALPFMSPRVGAMVQLQWLTGMRPGEVCTMTTGAVDRTGPVWVYSPQKHKTAYRGHRRAIMLGPKAQAIVEPWLRTDPDAFLFQPAESAAEARKARSLARVTPMNEGNRPRLRLMLRIKPGTCYRLDTYRRCVQRACDRAGVKRWHPHQIRHSFGTRLRAECGVEHASVLLGHRNISTTEIYAEKNLATARLIMAERG